MNLTKYKSILFDCDGVILRSNHIKTEAFRAITQPFGINESNRFVEYHMQNGGVSRYRKIDYFVDKVLPTKRPTNGFKDRQALKDWLLSEFANRVKQGLMSCEASSRLAELRSNIPDARWFIVSGADQEELREVFKRRKLDIYFNGGIYGSPTQKVEIVEQLHHRELLEMPSLFIGDSRLDHEVAQAFNLDFLFISGWTEFEAWESYCRRQDLKVIPSLDLLADA